MNIFIDFFLIAVFGYFGWFGLLVVLGTLFANGDDAKEKKIATLSAWIMATGCVIFFLDKNGFLSIL